MAERLKEEMSSFLCFPALLHLLHLYARALHLFGGPGGGSTPWGPFGYRWILNEYGRKSGELEGVWQTAQLLLCSGDDGIASYIVDLSDEGPTYVRAATCET